MYKNKNNNLNNEYLKIKFHYLNYNINKSLYNEEHYWSLNLLYNKTTFTVLSKNILVQ